MLIPLAHRVDAAELERLLKHHFPELTDTVEEGTGLVYLQLGALKGLANRCIKAGDFTGLARAYEFIGDLARHRSEIHSDILNAIHVSFLEGLNFANRAHGEKAKAMLPLVLSEMWEAQMEHNRRIFGLK